MKYYNTKARKKQAILQSIRYQTLYVGLSLVVIVATFATYGL